MLTAKLLALDVEGTIITAYDYSTELEDDRYPAIIDQELSRVLKIFSDAGFQIVLATGTSGDNLEYYQNEFKKAGIDKFIKKYLPEKSSKEDPKVDKLFKYTEEFNISDMQNIYFFDDANNNVQDAKSVGFVNSFQVTTENPLSKQLSELSEALGLKKASQFSSNVGTMFVHKATPNDESKSLLDKNTDTCCSPCVIL